MAIVYQHRRLDTNEIFYIGIGKELKRAYSRESRNLYWKNIVKKCDYIVEILYNDISWDDACYKEIGLIKLYGRKDLGTGPLANMTEGGDGVLGFKFSKETLDKISAKRKGSIPWNKGIKTDKIPWNKGIPMNDELKKKISDSTKGHKLSDYTKKKMSDYRKGKTHSEEWSKKISESLLGKKQSIEHAKKSRLANSGRIQKRGICKHCGKDVAVNILVQFHNDNCKLK